MRICFVTLGFDPLRTSGLDLSGERLVKALANAGQEIVVVAAGDKRQRETEVPERVTIHRLPLGASNWIGYSMRASALVSELKKSDACDIVHFWDVHFAWRYNGEYIATLHQSFRQRQRALVDRSLWGLARMAYYPFAERFFEGPALRRAKLLTAVSAKTRREFGKSYNIGIDSIHLTKHFIDSDRFKPSQDPAKLRRSLDISSDSPVLLFVGFITPRKGLDDLAKVFVELNKKLSPTPTLVILGKWNSKDKMRFSRAIGEYGDRVRYAGFIHDDELSTYYSMADLYISTSRLEGFGLPLAEAMACETPVIAFDAGAVREVVGPGGVIISKRSPSIMAEEAAELLMDQERLRMLGERGRAHVREHFSKEVCINSYLKSYNAFYESKTS